MYVFPWRVTIGGHCCVAASKLEEMNYKLHKILSLFTDMEAVKKRVDQLEETNKKLEEAANSTNVEILNLKSTTVYSSNTVDKVTKEFSSLEEEVLKLKCRNIKLEAFTRRENLKLFDTEEIVRKTLVEEMSIPVEDFKRIRFEHVHRMRTRKVSSRLQPVTAKFSFYQDKEFIWSFIRNPKGSIIGMTFPKEIDEIREKLYPILKKAEQDRQSAYFKVDKLTINVQVYIGKETEDLLHYGAIM